MLIKIIPIILCFSLISQVSCQSPVSKQSSKQTSSFNLKQEVIQMEKEATKYWQAAYDVAKSAKKAFENINVNIPGDLELSIEIIKKAIEAAEIAADIAGDHARAIGTDNARRIAKLATQELDNAKKYLEKALALKAKNEKTNDTKSNKK